MQNKLTTYKGFKHDLTCRGFQFELDKTFEHTGKVEACSSGFHSCEYPLDCLGYYPPAESRYAETVASGQISKEDGGDSKIASATITIKAELSVHQLVTRAIDWIWSRVDKSLEQTNTGDYSAASNTGDYSAASNTGDYSVAAAFGIESKARASEKGAIVLCYRNDEGELIHIRASKIGDNGVKPHTWYKLDADAQFVEIEE